MDNHCCRVADNHCCRVADIRYFLVVGSRYFLVVDLGYKRLNIAAVEAGPWEALGNNYWVARKAIGKATDALVAAVGAGMGTERATGAVGRQRRSREGSFEGTGLGLGSGDVDTAALLGRGGVRLGCRWSPGG